jgi:hypothetical protein
MVATHGFASCRAALRLPGKKKNTTIKATQPLPL